MPLPVLNIEDVSGGLPRQPVPLRMVPRIIGMPVEAVLAWLSQKPMQSLAPILRSYEPDPGCGQRLVRCHIYAAILRDQKLAEESEFQKTARLHPNYFVFSDELANAFTAFIDLYMDREQAAEEGMALYWNPALDEVRQLIEECPDFAAARITPRSKQETRKQATRERNADWKKRVKKIQQGPPALNHSEACRRFEKELTSEGVTVPWSTIRRATQ